MEKIKKKYSKTDCLILGIGFLILGLFGLYFLLQFQSCM